MAEGVSARLTPRELRRFGLTVGGAFLVLATVAWWRGHPTSALVLAALGAVLILSGLVAPASLGPVERTWMGFARAVSRITTPIVMGVIYFVIVTPVGLLRRWLGGHPLVHRASDEGFWKTRPAGTRRSASMERQF